MKPRLLLLDRDGTVNVEREGFITDPSGLKLIQGAGQAIAQANRAGVHVALVTNQSVVGRGIISLAQLDEIHAHLGILLAEYSAKLDAIYVATDHPERPTPRRKPGAEMLKEALNEFGVSASESVMIGDSMGDLLAAKSLGMKSVLVKTGKGEATLKHSNIATAQPFSVEADIGAAIAQLLGN